MKNKTLYIVQVDSHNCNDWEDLSTFECKTEAKDYLKFYKANYPAWYRLIEIIGSIK